MNPSMTPDEEYRNFKQLLKFFVGQWRKNTDPKQDHCSGQGYKKTRTGRPPRIFNFYKDYREYKDFDLDCSLQMGTKQYSCANYIQAQTKSINILPVFDEPRTDMKALKMGFGRDFDTLNGSNEFEQYFKEYSIDSLDLFIPADPNETLKEFFDKFRDFIEQATIKLEEKEAKNAQAKTQTAVQELETENASVSEEAVNQDEPEMQVEYKNKYSQMLIDSKNIIFHGAPGTGKTYLAKQIAADIVSNGHTEKYEELTEEQLKRIELVQFHPSYDYTDFVEGLRPCKNHDGSIGFELKDGIFKTFVDRARKDSVKRKYVFIIDEINRGEISKIFGELFFSIDPEYRGEAGKVSTQYSNLHDDLDEKFYIPENVYIIGTMNDIDRSVDTFDFAMRRRFRFIELRADDHVEMLDGLDNKDEVLIRMKSLNKAIAATQGLNGNYQIGAAYFLKLNKLSFDQLWTDYLQPLLQDYIQGMDNEKGTMEKFEKAYNPGDLN